MARSLISSGEITRDGLVLPAATTANATDDHYFVNDGAVFLYVVSTDAGTQTLTIVANPDLNTDGLSFTDLTLTILAGATKLFGPFRTKTFKQPSDSDFVYVNPSVSTTLTIRALKLTNVT